MKKYLIFFSFALFLGTFMASCSRGTGCPAETAQSQTDKRGNFKASKTTQHLFPQKSKKKKSK